MPNYNLNEAIQFIQAGQPEQAQPILQSLIQANPQDLEAWSWYVKSCSTPEKRLKALEMCLKFNPGNPQVMEAIEKTREKLSAQQPAVESFSRPLSSVEPSTYDAAYSIPIAHELQVGLPPHLRSAESSAYAFVSAPAAVSQTETLSAPAKFTGLDEAPGRPFIWYEVWQRALMQANADSYTALLRDPLASPGRAYWWVFMAALITGMVSLVNPSVMAALNQFEQLQGGENFSTIVAVILVVLVPVGAVFSILGLMLEAAIYDLLSKSFGGSGNFSRTVYLLGAYTAPLSIITGILSIIPFINCLTLPLAFYSFWLSVLSVQAAQRLNGGRATIVILIPGLIVFMLICIILVVGGQELIKAIPLPSQPTY
jgi:hypothetical protein